MARRRLIIYSLLACALILAAAILFIATFDADRYRTDIEAALSDRLDHPVRIGQIETSLVPEPLVILTELQIGDVQSGFAFSADRLTLKPKTKQLLTGEFNFHEIVAESPHLLTTLDTRHRAEKAPAADAFRNFNFTIDSLTAANASWRLNDKRRPDSQRTYSGKGFAIEASGVTARSIETFEASGTLIQGEDSAGVDLNGHLIPQGDGWRHSDIAVNIETEPLGDDFLALLPLPDYALEGPAALALDLRGQADSGIDVTARMHGERIALKKTGTEKALWSADAIDLSASLQVGENILRLRNIDLKAANLSLIARLLARQETKGVLLEATIEKASFPLALAHSGRFTDKRLLRLDNGELATLLTDARLPGLQAGVPVDDMPQPDSLELSGAGRIEPQPPAQNSAGAIPFRLSATVSKLSAAEPLLDAQIDTTLSETNIPDLMTKLESEDLQVGGKAEARLRLNGTPGTIRLDIDADLTELTLKSGKLLSKDQGDAGRLRVQGERRPDGWDITAATLDLPPLNVSAEGRLRHNDDWGYDLSVSLARLDLAEAHGLVPILEKIGLHGEVEGQLDLSSAGRNGTFELHHVGLPVPGKLAELNHLSGTVNLKGKQLEAPQLQALLGESPVDLSLVIEDLARPRFDIHLESPSMRASDLIFPNRQASLRDLVADFVISGDGLHLVDVRTRLDGGTVAHVEGTISPFAAPDTMLAIDAEYGDIDEVIALFRGPESEQKPRKKKKRLGEVLIDITARKGRFSTLEFTDAEGFLAIRNGLLTIHPLTFQVGKGYFTGMLLRSGSGRSPHRLKISGHLEDFDADALYSEQLKHQGIITGKLRGDFYLEGIEGKGKFLESSRGTFNVEIDGGVLRKFKVLAKVFSILNVSQLFKFQLPDTSSRGMPYDKLMATVRMREGVLETDDLFIDSEAMNMTVVGKLNLLDKALDLTIGVKPLQTVDKIITKIPIAGWLLTGEEKALITTHFEVTGNTDDPKVRPIPISSVSDKAKGIFRRLFGLPGKIIEDVEEFFD